VSHQQLISPRDEIVNTMVDLGHLSRSHRIVIAGSGSVELYLALRRRGFVYPILASSRRICLGQCAAALIAGNLSYSAIETALAQTSGFLEAAANVAVSIESQESGLALKVRTKLQQLGFRIEAGARCREAFVLAAHRQDVGQGFGQNFGTIANVA
jgi:hypothetical protein